MGGRGDMRVSQLILFQQADVISKEVEHMVLPDEAGGDLRGVAPGSLLHSEVGGDHRVPVGHQPGVQQLIQGGLDELGGQLAAQVIQKDVYKRQVWTS